MSSPASRLTLARICYQSLFPTLLMIPVWASLLAALLPPTSCVLCCCATVQFLCVQPCNSGDPRATHLKFTFYFRVILCHLLHLKKLGYRGSSPLWISGPTVNQEKVNVPLPFSCSLLTFSFFPSGIQLLPPTPSSRSWTRSLALLGNFSSATIVFSPCLPLLFFPQASALSHSIIKFLYFEPLRLIL